MSVYFIHCSVCAVELSCIYLYIIFHRDSVSDEVHIHGPKEEVSKAKSMLSDIANKHAEANFTVEITCKPEYHRFLIGRGGAKIRKVRDEFDARIIFPQKESDDDSDAILIIGRKENVEKAKEHLLKLIKDLVREDVRGLCVVHVHVNPGGGGVSNML